MMFGKDVSFGGRAAAAPGHSLLCMSRVPRGGAAAASRRQLPRARRRGHRAGRAWRARDSRFSCRPAPGSTVRSTGRSPSPRATSRAALTTSFKKLGVAYLPAARLEQGLVPGLSLSEHFVLSEPRRGVFIDKRRAADVAAERICTYNIKGAPVDHRGIPLRRQPAAHAPGSPAGAPVPGPPGAPDARAGHRVHPLHLGQAAGALRAGHRHRLHLGGPRRGAAVQRPHHRVFCRAGLPAAACRGARAWRSWGR